MVGAAPGASRTYASDMLVGRTGLSPVMVGRAAELDRLAQLLGARRTPSVALIAGEAGVGKTRLVQELLARVPAGTLVLAGPDGGQLLLVGSYRPDGLTRRHPAAELLPRLERRHSVTHLNLGPLSPSDVGSMLTAVFGQVPSFRVVEALHTRTGGNPYFLEELIAASGSIELEELCTLPLPWTVAEVVRGQVDDLGPEERRIVSAAAVLGRRVPF